MNLTAEEAYILAVSLQNVPPKEAAIQLLDLEYNAYARGLEAMAERMKQRALHTIKPIHGNG